MNLFAIADGEGARRLRKPAKICVVRGICWVYFFGGLFVESGMQERESQLQSSVIN